MTWGEFKRHVEKQLAEANGDEEEVLAINWSGLERPLVDFQTVQHGRQAQNRVLIT